jgi:hypothetical protein
MLTRGNAAAVETLFESDKDDFEIVVVKVPNCCTGSSSYGFPHELFLNFFPHELYNGVCILTSLFDFSLLVMNFLTCLYEYRVHKIHKREDLLQQFDYTACLCFHLHDS